MLILAACPEDAFHTCFDESVERLFELCVRVRVLELKEVEIALLVVEVEPIDSVIVPAERYLRDGPFTLDTELLLHVRETKIVIADPAAGCFQIREQLIDCPIYDCHPRLPTGLHADQEPMDRMFRWVQR